MTNSPSEVNSDVPKIGITIARSTLSATTSQTNG
jgi:hypothetical protein